MTETIRRQAHGIKAQSITITFPAEELAAVRDEASAKKITPSRHIVELVRFARSVRTALGPGQEAPDGRPEEAAK